MSLRSSDKARLRDWYDTSGTWVVKITALYELVDRIVEKAVERRLAPIPSTCHCLWKCDSGGEWARIEAHPSCPAHPASVGGVA